jgi:methionine aminopeptidase
MAAAGAVVARALAATRAAAEVGVRLTELDHVDREVLRTAGAESPFLGYQPSFAHSPYSGVVCLSVNDAVLHGIATDYRLVPRRRSARVSRRRRRLDVAQCGRVAGCPLRAHHRRGRPPHPHGRVRTSAD